MNDDTKTNSNLKTEADSYFDEDLDTSLEDLDLSFLDEDEEQSSKNDSEEK